MFIPLNAAQVRTNQLWHGELAFAGSSYKFPKASDKQVTTIRLNLLLGKRMVRPKLLAEIADGRSHLWKGDMKLSTSGVQNMGLNEIHEREQHGAFLWHQNWWFEKFL